MKKLLLLVLILIPLLQTAGQESVWDRWDPAVLKKAATAEGVDYMSAEEKKVITLMNLARLDGKLFGETFLEEWLRMNGPEKSPYVRSLYRDLAKCSQLPLIYPERDLTLIAQGHARTSGQTGHVGHKNFDKRFKPVLGNPYSQVGENCSYGYNTAIEVVITLLIDEDIQDVGHRKNILNPAFNSAGVSFSPHISYRYNCVTDFGSKMR